MYKVSVIIPVYNAEKYLERTINSIINQTIGFENIELLLADDLSTDGSRKIITEYSQRYDNIVPILSDVNHGFPGYGRNKGIDCSTGKYIMFADNDDEYALDYCETMYNVIESNNADVVCANYKIQKKSELVKMDIFSEMASELNSSDNPLKIDLNKYVNLRGQEVWTKIFKSSIIKENNIKFIDQGLNEDTLFIQDYYYHAKNIIYTDYYGYTWYRDGENLSYYSVKSTLAFINSYYEIFNRFNERYDSWDVYQEFNRRIASTIIRIIFSSDDKKDQEYLLDELYNFEKYIGFSGSLEMSWADKLNKLILKRKFSLVIALMKVLKNGKKLVDYIK